MQRIRQNGYVLVGTGIIIGILIARANIRMDSPVEAAGAKVKSPTGVAPERYVY